MTPLETAGLLTAEFPELASALRAPNMLGSVYRHLDCFAAFTRRAIAAGRLEVLRHCFAVADNLLRHADYYLANAINSVYLRGLHLDGSAPHAHLVSQLMPAHLYQAYCRPPANAEAAPD